MSEERQRQGPAGAGARVVIRLEFRVERRPASTAGLESFLETMTQLPELGPRLGTADLIALGYEGARLVAATLVEDEEERRSAQAGDREPGAGGGPAR